jgi:predicted AAA+ superfamily ATPase
MKRWGRKNDHDMYKRILEQRLNQSTKSVLLLGPRQVGKATLIQNQNPDVEINLAFEDEYLRHSTDASLLESILRERNPKTVFVDEIQRIPSLLNTIQALLDEAKRKKKVLRFFLTGSSARKLKRGQANLLPGRVFAYRMLGLSLLEIADERKSWDQFLSTGFLPEAVASSTEVAQKLLRSYAGVFVKEEIQAEALTRNLQGFSRFLKEIAESTGQVLDYSKLSKRSNISRTTCIRFVEILEDTMLAESLPCFSGTSADVIRHPKLFFFDVGVLNGLLSNFMSSGDRKGLLNEQAIYNQIRNTAAAKDVEIELFYFRTRHGLEVDFILKVHNKIWAIEVKSGSVQSEDLSPLLEFKKYCPTVFKLVVVSPKETLRKRQDVTICSPHELIRMINWDQGGE